MPTRHMERRQEDTNPEDTQLFDDFQAEFEMHYNLPEASSQPPSTTQDSFRIDMVDGLSSIYKTL